MTTTVDLLRTELLGLERSRSTLEAHFNVFDPEGMVKVRYYLGRTHPWRCRIHGDLPTADCEHTFPAALILAEKLLGLTVAAIAPNPERNPA